MTSTDRSTGAPHPAAVVLTKETLSTKQSTDPFADVRRVVSVCARVAFVVWLFVVTDGAAFSPYSFFGDIFGEWMWQPLLAALSLAGVVIRTGGKAFRGSDYESSGRMKERS